MIRRDLIDILEDGCAVHSPDHIADLIAGEVERWLRSYGNGNASHGNTAQLSPSETRDLVQAWRGQMIDYS
jgi:hypothetical protein